LSRFLKEPSVDAVRMSGGRLFHAAGPATLNARFRRRRLVRVQMFKCSKGNVQKIVYISSSSSSSLFVQIKIHDANKEQMIKPEQDSKVEKPNLLLPLNRERKKHRICIIHYN